MQWVQNFYGYWRHHWNLVCEMACSAVSNFSVFQEDSGSGVLVTVTSLSERKINDKQPRRGWKNMILVA
jgi:hypothetical protein